MPVDQTQYLTLISFEPRTGISFNVSTRPQFRLRFNIPVNENLVNTEAGLNQFVTLVKMSNDETVPVTSGTVDAVNRLLTFYPAQNLTAGATYQITIHKELETAQGRKMLADRIWTFTVSSTALGQVTLRDPGDATAWSSPPTLYWDGVSIPSGSVTYRVQLHDDWQFASNLLWTTTTVVSGSNGVQSTNIGISLNARSEYFWRVRAETPSATGDWSDTYSFWLGDSISASPDTVQLYNPNLIFRLLQFTPDDGTPDLSSFPTIRATFTDAVASGTITSGTFQLFRSPVDGSIELGDPSQVVDVVYTILGNVVDLEPQGTIDNNTRYTIVLKSTIESSGGLFLEEEQQFYFTGPYTPRYGGVIGVRSSLGGFIRDIGDDQILFGLWRGSLQVNWMLATRIGRVRESISITDLINYNPAKITWGMLRYAELWCAIDLLESYYYDLTSEAGRRVALSTYEHEVSVELLRELRAKIDALKKELEKISATFFGGIVMPRVTGKSVFWNPDDCVNPMARDYSYRQRPKFWSDNPWKRDLPEDDPRRNF